MKNLRLLLLCLSAFVPQACGSVRSWREMDSAPMTYGECFDGFVFVATRDGFLADESACDRGLGLWLSRWRQRVLERGFAARYRLRAEILVEEGSNERGWPIRYYIEQEKVKDLRRFSDPREEDWSADGQDEEREAILGEKLLRRLAPKAPATQPR
jgi:hypothetical protein